MTITYTDTETGKIYTREGLTETEARQLAEQIAIYTNLELI